MNDKVKRTERGWCGHFIGGADCLYHRNTLLEYGDVKIVVSTIGRYLPLKYNGGRKGAFEMVGLDRYFETMAFVANDSKYRDADVSKQVRFGSNWGLSNPDMEIEADEMHENVVAEISQMMIDNQVEYYEY